MGPKNSPFLDFTGGAIQKQRRHAFKLKRVGLFGALTGVVYATGRSTACSVCMCSRVGAWCLLDIKLEGMTVAMRDSGAAAHVICALSPPATLFAIKPPAPMADLSAIVRGVGLDLRPGGERRIRLAVANLQEQDKVESTGNTLLKKLRRTNRPS
jgi:hypothetical protein